jgi:hypothetical protein
MTRSARKGLYHFRSEDYARRYQWPNAFCPSPIYFVSKAQETWRGKLVLASVEDHGHRQSALHDKRLC